MDSSNAQAVIRPTPGVEVRHRKGYLALPPLGRKNSKARLEDLDRVIRSPIEASGIALTAEIERADGQAVNERTVVIRMDAASLTWEEENAVREDAIDVVIAQSLPNGQFYTAKETTVNLTADAERYAQMIKDGFTLTSTVTLRPDAYHLHVVISDVPSLSAGSLIIPLSQLR